MDKITHHICKVLKDKSGHILNSGNSSIHTTNLSWKHRDEWCVPITIQYDPKLLIIDWSGAAIKLDSDSVNISILNIVCDDNWCQINNPELRLSPYTTHHCFYYQRQWWLLHTNNKSIEFQYEITQQRMNNWFWCGTSVSKNQIFARRINQNLCTVLK